MCGKGPGNVSLYTVRGPCPLSLYILDRDTMSKGPGISSTPEIIKRKIHCKFQQNTNFLEVFPCIAVCQGSPLLPEKLEQRLIRAWWNSLVHLLKGTNGTEWWLAQKGTLMVATLHLSYKVLDHLTVIVVESEEKIISSLHKCLDMSNLDATRGKKLERRRKEKKQRRHKVLKSWESQAIMMEFKTGSSNRSGRVGLNDLLIFIDFTKGGIL